MAEKPSRDASASDEKGEKSDITETRGKGEREEREREKESERF